MLLLKCVVHFKRQERRTVNLPLSETQPKDNSPQFTNPWKNFNSHHSLHDISSNIVRLCFFPVFYFFHFISNIKSICVQQQEQRQQFNLSTFIFSSQIL